MSTNLTKRTLKKLMKDTCTVFSFNNALYEQVNGVSMGSSLGPVLANVLMTEFEKVVVQALVDDRTLPFYIFYLRVFSSRKTNLP